MSSVAEILRLVTELWRKQLEGCERRKRREFGAAAKEIMSYVGTRRPWDGIEAMIDGVAPPMGDSDKYLHAINMTQAFVDVMTPYVFAHVPNRLVSPRRPQIPAELEAAVPEAAQMQKAIKEQDTMISFLLQWWLNYCPKITRLAEQGKIAVQEALSKGRGVLWMEMAEGPEGLIPAHYADNVDNLFIDADARQLREAGYIVRRRQRAAYAVAEEYGEDVKELRGKTVSSQQQAVNDIAMSRGRPEIEQDICEYWEIWSRIGLGHQLLGAPEELQQNGEFRSVLDQIGQYVHFAIFPSIDHPLGMRPEIIESLMERESKGEGKATEPSNNQPGGEQLPEGRALDVLMKMLEWPIKTYANADNPWPMSCLDFKPRADSPWPKPILESALPLQRFIDRIAQTMMTRVRSMGRDVGVCSAAMEEQLMEAFESEKDLLLVTVNEDKVKEMIENYIAWVKFPEMNKDIIPTMRMAQEFFREFTGLDPAVFGGIPKTQDRSAKASSMRESGLSRRPDDYADAVEAWMSDVSAAEALAARLLVDAETVAPLFGEAGNDGKVPVAQDGTPVYGPYTKFWVELVTTDNPAVASAEMNYEVEAGSGRRRNKQLLQQNAQQLYTMLGQQLYAVGELTLNFKPYVAILRLMGDAFDMPVEPIIDAFEEAIMQYQQQQQGAQAQGQPGEGAAANPMTSAVDRSYQRFAGGPRSQGNLSPPPQTG